MALRTETAALNQIDAALSALRNRYAVAGGSENRRDQIKAFLASTFDALAMLTDAAGADALIVAGCIEPAMQDMDCAFLDAIEAEDAAEPRIIPVAHYGTYQVGAL